ncbi:MAG TPA: peptidoglycan DD-metalloendopeptidase family protein [Acidimicrobiia bacterium]
MGFRSPSAWSRALVIALTVGCVVTRTTAASAAVPGTPGTWMHPVPGAVAAPFVAPKTRYGAGHRGVDFTAPAGTAVRAANAGEVVFAGAVAGSLHVVVAHPGNLRTSYSFLASVTVRRGQAVARGDVVGTAGGGAGEHAGVLHFGLRVGDRYVDPMVLFRPPDLSRLIRLVPADEPAQAGYDPPAVERRSLADSLHLAQGVLPADGSHGGSGPLDALSGVWDDVTTVARTLAAPARSEAEVLGRAAGWVWRSSLAAPIVADETAMAERVLAWARSRTECTADTRRPASGGGSGHLAMTVAGIDSSTDPATGRALDLDATRLGYRAGEVRSFSYAPDGGAYSRAQTWSDLRIAARRLESQLREVQREQPGREVDLIAHSQGGVVVAEFLAHVYDPGDPGLPPLGSVVALSSPLQGAPAATAVGRVRSTNAGRAALGGVDAIAAGAIPPTGATATGQLAEGSSLIRGLRATAPPEQIDVTSIGGADDVIVPADHIGLPGARVVTVDPAGIADHGAIVRDPAALDAARLALEDRSPPCVDVVTGIKGAVEPVLISRAEHTVGAAGQVAGLPSGAAPTEGARR